MSDKPNPDRAQQTPEHCQINSIIEQKRGCLTCRDPDCPVWQTADQNCWKSQVEHDAHITGRAREDFANQLKAAVNCAGEMKDREQCGHCPYRKCKDNGYYDCDIDGVLGSTPRSQQPEPKERDDAIRQDERDKIYMRLEKLVVEYEMQYHEEQAVRWADIDCLFAEMRAGEPNEARNV